MNHETGTKELEMGESNAYNARMQIFPPLVYLVALGIGLLLQWIVPIGIVPFGIPRLLGWSLVILGSSLSFWGRNAMATAKTSPNPALPTEALVTMGPYRFSRNPLYVAATVAYIGVALITNSVWIMILLAPLLLIVHFGIIRGEERYLEAKFNDAYREYCAHVRRYV